MDIKNYYLKHESQQIQDGEYETWITYRPKSNRHKPKRFYLGLSSEYPWNVFVRHLSVNETIIFASFYNEPEFITAFHLKDLQETQSVVFSFPCEFAKAYDIDNYVEEDQDEWFNCVATCDEYILGCLFEEVSNKDRANDPFRYMIEQLLTKGV